MPTAAILGLSGRGLCRIVHPNSGEFPFHALRLTNPASTSQSSTPDYESGLESTK